jgi:hypothetical protein
MLLTKRTYQTSSTSQTQRRCFVILERRFSNAFVNRLNLEDGHPCRVRAIFLHDDKVRLDIYSLRSFDRAHTILYRALCSDLDYSGELAFGTVDYQVGVKLLHGEELTLRIFLRPRHLHRTGNVRLGVVR